MRRFKQEREKIKMTQNCLAELLGVTQQTISKYENGTREPDIDNLVKMAKIFHVSIDYLLGIEQESDSNSECIQDTALRIENKEEEKLLLAYRSLNADNKLILLGEALKEVRCQQTGEYSMPFSLVAEHNDSN